MKPRALIGVLALALILLGIGLGFLLGERSMPATGQPGAVDIGFSQDMSAHHSQAIEMTDIVAANPDPAVTTMAARIKTAQLEEIGRMQGFLALWDQPAIPTSPSMSWMGHDMADHPMRDSPMAGMSMTSTTMPGLATEDQLTRLRSLSGSAQAVLFLQLMLRHHQGGVEMSDYAAQHATLPAVKALAGRMSFDQQQENQILAQLLVDHGVDPRTQPG